MLGFTSKKIQTSNADKEAVSVWDVYQNTEKIIKTGRLKFRLVFWIIIFISILGYMSFQVLSISKPPYIEIYYPQNDTVVENGVINIKGKTEPESTLLLNNKPIYIDSDGYFDETLVLNPGVNVLTFEAERRYSKKKIVKINVYYSPDSNPLAQN